jgi:hypothetical protein
MEFFLIARDRFIDDRSRNFALLPTDDLHASSLEVFVDMEEMLHFLQIMLGKIGDVEIFVVIRVVTRHREDLVVGLAPISHPEHSQRTAVDLAAGKGRLIDVDEHIERISILV